MSKDSPDSATVSVVLPITMIGALMTISQKEDRSFSSVVRRILDNHLSQKPTLSDKQKTGALRKN